MAVQQSQTARVQIASLQAKSCLTIFATSQLLARTVKHLQRFALCGALLACLFILAGCENDDLPQLLKPSHTAVTLRNEVGSVATISLTTNGAWKLTATGAGFDVTPDRGAAGTSEVTIRATQINESRERTMLGNVVCQLTDNPQATQTISVSQLPAIASQTVLLYMPGTSLNSYYIANIEGIRRIISSEIPGNGRILICTQPTTASDKATLGEIYYDAAEHTNIFKEIKNYDPFIANQTEFVQQLLTDVAQVAPAQRYGLIIGSHGKAWLPAGKSITARSLGDTSTDENTFVPMPNALPTRGFGDPSREMDIAQLAEAIAAQTYRLDWIIFDACFMANIETLYDLRTSANRIIASPIEIMAAGFPYDRLIPQLFADNGNKCNLAGACETFYDFYMNDWESIPSNAQSGCISLAVTAELESLADVVRRINATNPASYNRDALQSYEGIYSQGGANSHIFYDFGNFIEAICTDQTLLTEFQNTMERAFPSETRFNTPLFYSAYNSKMNPISHYSGVSISEPSLRHVTDNQQTNWYKATH